MQEKNEKLVEELKKDRVLVSAAERADIETSVEAPASLADRLGPVEVIEKEPEIREPVVPQTPDLTMSDEERAFRARHESHRVLMRKHKPPITPERLVELQTLKADGEELRGYDQVQLRLAEKNGLLDERDLTHLRAADARRAKRAEKMKQRAARGEFRASERLAKSAPPVEGPSA